MLPGNHFKQALQNHLMVFSQSFSLKYPLTFGELLKDGKLEVLFQRRVCSYVCMGPTKYVYFHLQYKVNIEYPLKVFSQSHSSKISDSLKIKIELTKCEPKT